MQPEQSVSLGGWCTSGWGASCFSAFRAYSRNLGPAVRRFFPPEAAVHLVKLACERPDEIGRSLSTWFCADLARQLIRDEIVDNISSETVRRILQHHKLKPWRVHMWLSAKHPRDAKFYASVREIIDLYMRPLPPHEIVLSTDEKTSLQPRTRLFPTRPAQPGNIPSRVEHEYERKGALQLFAAFDTRTGKVYGQTYDRKRQKEFIAFLEHLGREVPTSVTTIHLVLDNVPTHHGKEVRKWLSKHPRFNFHFTPVYCSWMNQIEQWFSVLVRKRLRIADFSDKDDLRTKIRQFIEQWNEAAHPFNWSSKSVAKVMAGAQRSIAA